MTEVPYAGRHHHHAAFVCGGNHFSVAHAATGLDDAAGADIDDHIEAVTEGEKGIAGDG
jgi:hypothetical protein